MTTQRKYLTLKKQPTSITSTPADSLHNSLDWDSPSTKTGTVKRRPNSEDENGPMFSIFASSSPSKHNLTTSTTSSCSTISTTFSTYDNYAQVYDSCDSERNGSKSDKLNTRKCRDFTKVQFTSGIPGCFQRKPNQTQKTTTTSGTAKILKNLHEEPTNFGMKFTFSSNSPYNLNSGINNSGLYSGYQRIKSPGGKISDSDSGIASPLSPSSLNSFLGYSSLKTKDVKCDVVPKCAKKEYPYEEKNQRGDIEDLLTDEKIYTDWANHYLEKARSKKRVNSLAADCSDGVLLAEVIESVMCQKIPDINRKPKTPSQMLDNINLCLSALRTQHVAGVESVSGQDLRDGRLKAILALFFALSRHKQAAKQRIQQQQLQPPTNLPPQQEQMTPNRSAIPHKGGSSIPMPGSALPARRCPPDKVRPVAGSSRASSPALSMIPRGPPTTTVASPYQQPPQKNTSMLDKLKLFKSHDRPAPSTGKRTSSSSGVSSARSERSDSSISLEPTTEIKPVRNASRLKQQRPTKTATSNGTKSSPQSNKKDFKENKEKQPKTSVDVEKHANKVASIETRSKLVEPKVKVKDVSSKHHDKHNLYATPVSAGTGIPKPTAAIKGTTKVLREDDKSSKKGISRETSSSNLQPSPQPKSIGVVSPIKSEKQSDLLTESIHSGHSAHSNNSNISIGTTAGSNPHSNSSDSSVIYKPSSESSCDRDNLIPNRKEPLDYITETPLNVMQPQMQVLQDQSYVKEVKEVLREDKLLNTLGQGHAQGQCQTQTQVFNISLGNNQPTLQSQLLGQKPNLQTIQQTNSSNVIKEVSLTGQDEEMNVEPMRPLFRGYCSTLTLPSRAVPSRYPGGRAPDMNGLNGDYCEVSVANGYLSDGEILRNGNHHHGMHHQNGELDGYVSEGGNVLFARRLQTMPAMPMNHQIANGTPRISPSLTVLAEQTAGGRRARVATTDEPPPPPTGPRSHRSAATHRSNGTAQFPPPDKHSNQQWKRYTDSPGVGSPPPPPPAPSSPTSSRRDRERRSSPHGSSGSSAGGGSGVNGPTSNGSSKDKKVRGVPQSFGYVKRGSTATSTSTTTSTNGHHVVTNGTNGVAVGVGVGTTPTMSNGNGNGKTAQVSAVPRTKVKVSGGTQTCSSDLQPHKAASQFKSYSLTGNAATQLSQSVRERLMGSQSLPKGAAQEYSLMLRQRPPKASDGSLSDTQAVEAGSPYAPWLRHSNTYSVAPRLSETDSMESLTSLPGHRGSLTHARLLRDSPSRLSRSNSIRSTKSEKLYPSMLHRNNTEPESEPYYCLPVNAVLHWSQPTSPAPGTARTFPLSPTHSNARHSVPKNDEVHGSSISLVSTASSIYSSAEEKQAHEIRKLRRELIDAQEKVHTLTSQLSTNAHVVSAFEQSLSSMTHRLQNITVTSEKKDSELNELKAAMESLRAQSLQAGIGTGLARQPSSDSVSSLSSACSLDKQDKKKKKGWLRSSFTKAFSRNAKVTKVQCQNDTNGDNERHASPPPQQPAVDQGQEVQDLQKQLREKDLVLTDIRLEALTSAHQLESLKDTVMKMRSEMLSLKQNNERLQRMVSGSVGNIPSAVMASNSMDPLSALIATEELPAETEPDGKRIAISVYLGQPTTFQKYYAEHYENDGDGCHATTEISIAHTSVGAATSWGQLDNAVRRAFKQHVARLDPGGGLGLGSDSVALYKLGEAERASDSAQPDLLPVGYVVGHVTTLHVVLQPVAALSFEALIPKGVAQRLVSLLAEHRRLVLCGAPGTGKTHLATRLAEFHAQSLGRDPAEAVATFNVDNKSAKELRQYLAHLSEQAAAGDNSMLPCVVVLDNLHKAGPLADALGSLPRNLPCLIGTMAQSACSATSLQLQHGFRWVLVAPHMEPARGLLGRVLRRRLATLELDQGPQPELAAILGWLPRVWQHLNAFLETHSSGDVAIGPRLFLSCPLELDAARAWFADVWNYSLAPYLREAAREGLQLYGRRAAWSDPTQFVLDTYPWPGAPPQGLTSIPAKDVGLETGPTTQAENDGDPLLNMLMRLQEAANYSSPHSNDSDCNSLDSNLAHGNNLGTESVS